MLRQLEKAWQRFRFLGGMVLDSWGLLLTLMLIFAMNRYAVTWIEGEKRELVMRLEQIQGEMAIIEGQIEESRAKVKALEDPRFQEMMIMQKLLIVPDNHEMIVWAPRGEDK